MRRTNSQVANFLAPKQTLHVTDNVINTYNLLTAVCKLAPVFVVSVQTLFFDESAGRARKIWSGDETTMNF